MHEEFLLCDAISIKPDIDGDVSGGSVLYSGSKNMQQMIKTGIPKADHSLCWNSFQYYMEFWCWM